MPRDLPIGNGGLLIGFDLSYELRDIYYPNVGQENHTMGYPCRTGIWVEGQFAWFTDREWQRRMEYGKETLVTEVTMYHPRLNVTLFCQDTVDFNRPILVRRCHVTNHADQPREVRVFYHYDFHISGNGVGDTVYFDPFTNALIFYKDDRYFLAGGTANGIPGITSWATGVKELRGAEGTWRDAEDGVLGRNMIAQGAIDGTVALHHRDIPANGSGVFIHWLIAGMSHEDVEKLNEETVRRGPEAFLKRTRDFWRSWVNKDDTNFGNLPARLQTIYKRSLLTIRTQTDADGAIVAANDSDITKDSADTYSYVWPRDGALVSMALDSAGYSHLSRRFYEFCQRIMEKNGYFLHKYTPRGRLASSWHPWADATGRMQLPIQEDSTGLVIAGLWHHYRKARDVEFVATMYRGLIKTAADFLLSYSDPNTGLPQPSHDLWEERYGVSAFGISTVWAGLQAAANFTDLFNERDLSQTYRAAADEMKAAARAHMIDPDRGRFVRMISVDASGALKQDPTLDASQAALFVFDMFAPDDPAIVATMRAIEEELWVKTPIGGVARYHNDYYHQVRHDVETVPGNPWFICTLWLAEWYIACARTMDDLERPLQLLNWVADHALASGVLAEQLHPETGAPLSVSPLTWSHAAFVQTIWRYMDRERILREHERISLGIAWA